jgi:hypothetical protein
MMQDNGGGGRGTTAQSIQLNRQILDCVSTGELCELIEAHAEIMAKTRYRPWDPALVPKLERRAEALAGTFNAQHVGSTLWAYATMGREPGAGMMRELEGRAEAVAGTFNAQHVANTLWAYATMGREPGAGMMRELEGRAEAVAGTFKTPEVGLASRVRPRFSKLHVGKWRRSTLGAIVLALILVECVPHSLEHEYTTGEADKANFHERIGKWRKQRGLIHAGNKGRMKEEGVMEGGCMVSEERDTGMLSTAPSEQENKIKRNVDQGSQTEENSNFGEHLHGVTNHPSVAILNGAPVYDMDQFGARAMELDLHIQGCIAGFGYKIFAVIVEGDSLHPSFSVNGTWNTSSFSVTAIFTYPEVSKQYIVRTTLEDTLPGLPAEEKILSVRDLIFRAPFATKKSMSMEITAKAHNTRVFEAIRSRNFSDPVLPRGAALEMARTCSVDPLSYLYSVFQQSRTTSQSSKSSCIITAFDESHEEEGMLMVRIAC